MVLQVTRHTDTFATSPQIGPDDMPEIAALGFRTIINNRPDGEGGPSQPLSADLERAAQAAGLGYIYQPVVSGQLTQEQARQFAAHLAAAPQPVFAFCRSGTRCTNLFRLAASTPESSAGA